MIRQLNVLGIAGSLRKGSYNRALLRTAKELAPSHMTIEIFELDNIPLYNADVEREGVPQAVKEFKDKIRGSDALLFVTPEYNFSIPGVLKNAFDWASRPPTDSPLNGKPAAIMGATTGWAGTKSAQLALRQAFIFTNTLTFADPQVYVSRAQEKFDANGTLIDEEVTDKVRNLLHALAEWTLKLTD